MNSIKMVCVFFLDQLKKNSETETDYSAHGMCYEHKHINNVWIC